MVSFPTGKTVIKNADLVTVDFLRALVQLQKKNFSGYVALCIRGTSGFEEGTVLFDGGKIVGCAYEYFKYGKEFQGQEAFQRIINATAAKQGIIDAVELTAEQVQLVLAINQKLLFVPDQRQLETLKVKEFSPLFENQTSAQQQPEGTEAREDLLKKYKMGGLLKE